MPLGAIKQRSRMTMLSLRSCLSEPSNSVQISQTTDQHCAAWAWNAGPAPHQVLWDLPSRETTPAKTTKWRSDGSDCQASNGPRTPGVRGTTQTSTGYRHIYSQMTHYYHVCETTMIYCTWHIWNMRSDIRCWLNQVGLWHFGCTSYHVCEKNDRGA